MSRAKCGRRSRASSARSAPPGGPGLARGLFARLEVPDLERRIAHALAEWRESQPRLPSWRSPRVPRRSRPQRPNRAFDGLAGPGPAGPGPNGTVLAGTWPAWTEAHSAPCQCEQDRSTPSPACRNCVPGPRRRLQEEYREVETNCRVGQAELTGSKGGEAGTLRQQGPIEAETQRPCVKSNWPRREPPWPCSKRGRGPEEIDAEQARTWPSSTRSCISRKGSGRGWRSPAQSPAWSSPRAEGEDRPVLPEET